MTKISERWELFTERAGNKNIVDHLLVGDAVTGDLDDHMSLETDKYNYLQLNEIQGYCYDLVLVLRPVYPTFVARGARWRYYGSCYKWESINRF